MEENFTVMEQKRSEKNLWVTFKRYSSLDLSSMSTCLRRGRIDQKAVRIVDSGQSRAVDRCHTHPVVGANLQIQLLVSCPRGGAT